MMTRKWIAALLFLVCGLILIACTQETSTSSDNSLADVEKKGKLVVATETGFAPFAFKTLVDGKDTLVGSDIEMVKAIAAELGVEVEFDEMSFDNVLTAVQSGKADIGISGISVTEERQEAFAFSTGYYTATNKIIIRTADSNTLTSLDSLSGLTVAAQKGSIQESVVTDQIPSANLVSLTETGEMINELKSGKVDAVVLEEPIAKGYVAINDDLMIADIQLDSSDSDTYAIALPKNSQALKAAIDKILDKMVEDGQIETYIQEAYDLSLKN